jgi:hypothetical protein
MEIFKRLQKHGSSKCVILAKYERELLKLGKIVKITIENGKYIIEAATPEEEANYVNNK